MTYGLSKDETWFKVQGSRQGFSVTDKERPDSDVGFCGVGNRTAETRIFSVLKNVV
jgi:hypothetical protein